MATPTWESPDIDRYVAAAAVLRDQKVLVVRRNSDDFMGGVWELPSGKVDTGESIQQALERELKEETGLGLRATGSIVGTFDYESRSGRRTRQVTFAVAADGTDVTLTEHDAAEWINVEQAATWPVTEETRHVILKALAEDG
ncbi:NUDIX domain-containing protein [Streptomyces lydicus]|uniref:NUDIX domain-containing protein n=1 Tax=Streptomyces lydicus TaxID=47763 RepID=UPI0036FC72A4